ncbi:prostaglandin F2-alpha receptor-like [Pecten maximus]|uniref:prostaglandin F2-alpha receptor-like n=1 Tax=Pecten maximus TaxID=6579 RepID=UPI0014584C8E|nr:prostaglandin F2-alpha receptor-like [Pecten maximus]
MFSLNINTTTYNLTTESPLSLNTTDETPFVQPRPLYGFIIWFTFGIIGNCTAIAILIRNKKKHQWKIFYKLVLMLTLSDFTAQMVTLPITFIAYSDRNILVTERALCVLMSTVTIVTSLMSVSFVCLMSIDRAVASQCPLFYRNKVSSCHLVFAVTLVIVMSVIVGILPLLGVNMHKVQRERTWCFVDIEPKEQKDRAFLYLSASIGISAVLLMLIMNAMVLHRLCVRYKKTQQTNHRISRQITVSSGVKKVQNIFFLLAVMAVFIASWIPAIIRFLNNAIEGNEVDHEKDTDAVALTIMHQVLNPWIYIIMQDCLFSRCLTYAKRHSKRGSIFHRILEDFETKRVDVSDS